MDEIPRLSWHKVDVEALQSKHVSVDWLIGSRSSPAGVGVIVWDKEVGKANNTPLYCSLFPEPLQKALLKSLEFWNAGRGYY